MAEGNAVVGSRYNWKATLSASIVKTTDSTCTVRVTLGYASYLAIESYANGGINGGRVWDEWLDVTGNGWWQYKTVASREYTVSRRYGSSYTQTYTGWIQVTGGFGDGTSNVSVGVSIPARGYSLPNPPKGASVSRRSDTQAVVSWKGDYTSASEARPWANVYVERQTDGGGWSQVAALGWDATSFTDNGISSNHRYAYRVRSKNAAGYSDYADAGSFYTTPAAPSGCSASRNSDTQASVTWRLGSNAANSYVNVLIERQVDGGGWTQIATLGKSVTNYTDNGISSNHRYAYRVRSYNGLYSGYSTSGYIYTTPAVPRSVSLAKLGGTKVRITVASASPYADDYRYQLSVNGGAWTSEQAMGTSIDVDAGGGSVKARVRSRKGSLYSGYRESGTVTTIVPPNAPTMGTFDSVYALPATVRVTWNRNHPDGTGQTAAQVEVTDPSGKISTTTVEGGAGHAGINLSAEGEYRIRVRTKGLDASWGAWSPHGSLFAEYAPQAYFTTPPADGKVVEEIPFTVGWEVRSSSGVSSQEIRLLSDGGDVLHSAALGVDAREYSFSVETYLPQTLKDYTVVLLMSDGYSLTSQAERRFSTDYAEPAIPYIDVDNDMADMSSHVKVMQGEAGWTVDEEGMLRSPEFWDGSIDRIPVSAGFEQADVLGMMGIGTVVPTTKLTVARLLDDGSQEMVTNDLPSGFTAIDRLPPLNIEYTYLVTAYSAAGTATTVEVPAFIDSGGAEAYNFGADAATSILLGLDAQGNSSFSQGGEWFNFALGPDAPDMPTFYPDGSGSASGSHSYVVMDVERYRRLDALRRKRGNAVCWFRDHWGGRYRVKADWQLGYSAKEFGLFTASASLTETVWEDPVNG